MFEILCPQPKRIVECDWFMSELGVYWSVFDYMLELDNKKQVFCFNAAINFSVEKTSSKMDITLK